MRRLSDEPVLRLTCPCGQPATASTYTGNFCDACAALVPAACDFCNLKAPTWRYPCASFDVMRVQTGAQTVHYDSTDDWGACADCHALLALPDIDALLARMGGDIPALSGYRAHVETMMRDFQAVLVREFLAHQNGNAYAVNEKGERT